MSCTYRSRLAVVLCGVLAVAAPGFAAFPATDVFLPMVGRDAGIPPSQWYTKVWAYNPNASAAAVRFYFLERGKNNATLAVFFDDTIQPGDTRAYENVVFTMFGRAGWGAIRAVSSQKVIVNERFYNQLAGSAERDSQGQYFAGVPASFAIGLGTAAPGQQLELTGNLGLPATTSAATGVITKGGVRFLFNWGSGATFLGVGAGSFTTEASGDYNTGLGRNALAALTTGARNTAAGTDALAANTPGESNSALGSAALSRNTLGTANTAVGTGALLRLRPVTFRYLSQPEKLHFGLLAEEAAEVLPELVVHDAPGVPETVLYHELPALLLNELQKQQRRIEALEAEMLRDRSSEP